MITERSQAYGRIMRTLSACPGRVAAEDDIERLREACAALVFARSPSRRDRLAMKDAVVALSDLVARGCITSERAAAVVEDIRRCAPQARTAT